MTEEPKASALLAVMPDGIGDITFGSPEWVAEAGKALADAVQKHGQALAGVGTFTLCEVAHNPPALARVFRPLGPVRSGGYLRSRSGLKAPPP